MITNQSVIDFFRRASSAIGIAEKRFVIVRGILPTARPDACPINYFSCVDGIPPDVRPTLSMSDIPVIGDFYTLHEGSLTRYAEKVDRARDQVTEELALRALCVPALWNEFQIQQLLKSARDCHDLYILSTTMLTECAWQVGLHVGVPEVYRSLQGRTDAAWARGKEHLLKRSRGNAHVAYWMAARNAECEVITELSCLCPREENVFKFLRLCGEKLFEIS